MFFSKSKDKELKEDYTLGAEEVEEKDDDGKSMRLMSNPAVKQGLTVFAIMYTLFHVYFLCGVFRPLNILAMFSVHWAGGMVLAFMLYPIGPRASRHVVPIYGTFSKHSY